MNALIPEPKKRRSRNDSETAVVNSEELNVLDMGVPVASCRTFLEDPSRPRLKSRKIAPKRTMLISFASYLV